ncbi:MAG TPA: hypothetical protein VHA57_12360 [Actinomycetota bacterium]|nr:hypothetical protein [Actinomycetota bacterium]
MPHRASSASDPRTATTAVADRRAPASVEPRPGAEVRPDIVNVFEEGVSAGTATGLRLAPLGGRRSSDAIALSVRAWVRNLAYDKDLWIDVSLAGDDGELLHAESVSLSFLEPAGGGGDFFTIGTAVPAPTAVEEQAPTLFYRLYGQLSGQLYTDGVLHCHTVAAETTAAAAKTPVPAPPAKASTTAAKTKTETKPATKLAQAAVEPVKLARGSRDNAKAGTAKAAEKTARKAPEQPASKAAATRKRTAPKN